MLAWNQFVVVDGLKYLILLLPHSKCWEQRPLLLELLCVVRLGVKAWASDILGAQAMD